MAGKGHEIHIGANVRDVQRAAKDVEASFEDVADALDDVARDADKSGARIGDEISDGARDAERAVDKLERSFKELADGAKRETRQAGAAMQTNMKRGTDGAGAAISEWGDEAKANISETFSSFRGDAEDLVGIVQDTFGGVISGLGPMGMAAGAAGAVGIGLIMGAIERAKEQEQEFREQVAELADTLIETGGEGAEAVSAIADRLRDMAAPTEDGAKSLADITKEAKKAGIPVKDLVAAYGGAGGNLRKYIDLLDEEMDAMVGVNNVVKAVKGTRYEALRSAKESLAGLVKEQEAAEEAERVWHESGAAGIAARAEQMSALQGELDSAIGSWSEYIDAETGAANPKKYIKAMQARMDATTSFNANVARLAEDFGLTFEEQQAILDQGVDFAPMLQAIMDGGPKMQEQYAAQMQTMLDGGQAILDGRAVTATVTAEADTKPAETSLEKAAKTRRHGTITAKADTKAAVKSLDSTAKDRSSTIKVKLDLTDAERELSTWLTKARTITVDVQTRTGKAAK